MTTLEVGQLAPEFRLKGPGGQWVSLSDYRDLQNVVLVFFPLAFSPVCSHQLPEVNHRLNELRDLDTAVLGISVDSHYANTAFAKSLGLDFPLLSDFDHRTSQAYGVYLPEDGTAARALFVIDDTRTITWSYVSPTDITPDVDGALTAVEAIS